MFKREYNSESEEILPIDLDHFLTLKSRILYKQLPDILPRYSSSKVITGYSFPHTTLHELRVALSNINLPVNVHNSLLVRPWWKVLVRGYPIEEQPLQDAWTYFPLDPTKLNEVFATTNFRYIKNKTSPLPTASTIMSRHSHGRLYSLETVLDCFLNLAILAIYADVEVDTATEFKEKFYRRITLPEYSWVTYHTRNRYGPQLHIDVTARKTQGLWLQTHSIPEETSPS